MVQCLGPIMLIQNRKKILVHYSATVSNLDGTLTLSILAITRSSSHERCTVSNGNVDSQDFTPNIVWCWDRTLNSMPDACVNLLHYPAFLCMYNLA